MTAGHSIKNKVSHGANDCIYLWHPQRMTALSRSPLPTPRESLTQWDSTFWSVLAV